MKITVNEDLCCGAGQCVVLAPEVFDQRDEDAIVMLLEAQPGSSCTRLSVRQRPAVLRPPSP